jgi:aldehyde:ferredoxin oxidoreductase
MGSKNLKAIAVRGSGGVKVADPDKLFELTEYAASLLNRREQPSQYFPRPYFSKYYSPKTDKFYADLDKARVRWDSCQGCPIGCRYFIDVPGGGHGQVQCVDFYLMLLTSVVSRETTKATEVGNRLGINFFQYPLLNVLSTAFQKGYLTEQNTGLPFSKGVFSGEFSIAMFEAIAFKRGEIGAILAEGMPRLAYYIAKKYNDPSFEETAKRFGTRGMASHWSQHFPVNALTWALDSRDPYDDFHEYTYFYSMKSVYATKEEKKAAAKRAYGSEKAIDYFSWDYKAQTTKRLIERACIKSSLILCDWAFPIVMSQYTKDHMGDPSLESKLYSAVTGIETTEEEMYVIGERIFNLERAIMIREGRRREQDHCPYEFTLPTNETVWHGTYEDGPTTYKGVFVDPDYFNTKFLDEFYELAGWSKEGVPTRARLEGLGLKDVADSLGL